MKQFVVVKMDPYGIWIYEIQGITTGKYIFSRVNSTLHRRFLLIKSTSEVFFWFFVIRHLPAFD